MIDKIIKTLELLRLIMIMALIIVLAQFVFALAQDLIFNT